MPGKGKVQSYYELSPEQMAAAMAGKEALRVYCEARRGRAADLSRKTNILPPVLSKMLRSDNYTISLESALMIELATEGELQAEVLCPSRADVLRQVFARRYGSTVAN